MSPAIPLPVSAGRAAPLRRSLLNWPLSASRSVPGPWPASSSTSATGCASITSASRLARGPDRDEQFQHIAAQRLRFAERGLPIISIDTKKRELVGNFKNHGTTWERSPHATASCTTTTSAPRPTASPSPTASTTCPPTAVVSDVDSRADSRIISERRAEEFPHSAHAARGTSATAGRSVWSTWMGGWWSERQVVIIGEVLEGGC